MSDRVDKSWVDKTLYTSEGDAIPWFPKDYNNYLDKTTLIFGGTSSGKTSIVEEILFLLKDHIPNFLVIAPRTSDMAYRSKLPSRCIKEDFTKKQLCQLWDRQYQATEVYNTANKLELLESLFHLAPDRENIVKIEAIKRKAAHKINEIDSSNLDYGQKRAQKLAIEELQKKTIKRIYQDTIRKNKSIMLNHPDLTPHQHIAIEFLDFNPRLCLIIDDSSEKFQSWMSMFKKNEVNPFGSIFYKNRWNYLTLIIAAHDDKVINTEFRKNSRVTIYTTSQSLIASLNRQGNGFSSKEKKDIMKYATRIFADDERNGIRTHQKLCYVREAAKNWQYTIADLYPDFILGCTPVREMITQMPKLEDNLPTNPFAKELFEKEKKRKTNGNIVGYL